ncbi:MAG: hypothetical protein H7X99_09340 [Saprospiraceae bacterium]|nr:hypothetical protein [Saprospiraceae bacterium]
MLKSKVKISHVNNLTDARYFAAMGADYLGFCANPGAERFCAPAKIKEITDWVSGPQFVLEFDGWQEEDDIRSMLEMNLCHAVHLGVFATYENSFGVPSFKDFIFENLTEEDMFKYDYPVIKSDKKFSTMSNPEINNLIKYLSLKPSYLDINLKIDDLDEMCKVLPSFGLILRGGEEERTGVKSFDELDRIFDMLNE